MKSEELPKERTNGERPAYATNGRMHKDAMGLTKRELFAMAAMQGLLSVCDASVQHMEPNKSTVEYLAGLSVKAADELIKQLENGSK